MFALYMIVILTSTVRALMTMVTLTKSLCINTVTSIENLIISDGKPATMKNLFIVDIKNNIKQSNLTSKLIFLRKCLVLKIAPQEISAIAMKTVSELGSKTRQIKEECRIIRMRILEKERQIADSKRMMKAHHNKIHRANVTKVLCIVMIVTVITDRSKSMLCIKLAQRRRLSDSHV